MPTVAIVDGIRVVIFLNDHAPPHFHAFLGEHTLRVEIGSGAVLGGSGPAAMRRKLVDWAKEHAPALQAAWNEARNGRSPQRID